MRRIAAGGMAEVWMGRRRAMGGASKTVAVKLLASHLSSKPIYRRMFVDEARLTMMLTHSNIVQVFDVGEHEGRSYLVMEWVDGMDLSRLAASMRQHGEAFELHVVAHVIGEVLRALAYAHGLTEGDESSTIVHRDISPHNVLISVSGEVKLSDFGVARLASEETSGLHVRGKLRYMPPEQLRGRSKHATVDLFAVGAMMQELLDGVRFRAGLDRDQLFGMVATGEVPPLSRRGVPLELVALRDALLARDPADRVQSAGEALALLRRWPGYRNAADELIGLARDRAGVEAPRTGLTVECSDEQLELSDEPTVREGSVPAQDSELLTRTVRSADARGSETTPLSQLVASGRGRRLPLMLSLVLAGLGLNLGLAWAWVNESQPAAVVDGPAPVEYELRAEPPPEQPVLARVPEPEPESESEPELEQPESEDSTTSPEPSASPTPRKQARHEAGPPARVEFAAHEFFFVWVKVAGQAHALEPTAELSLAPGRHEVWLRERADERWVAAGRIEVAAGKAYRVKLRKPHALTLARRE